jgi:hypothetical protein
MEQVAFYFFIIRHIDNLVTRHERFCKIDGDKFYIDHSWWQFVHSYKLLQTKANFIWSSTSNERPSNDKLIIDKNDCFHYLTFSFIQNRSVHHHAIDENFYSKQCSVQFSRNDIMIVMFGTQCIYILILCANKKIQNSTTYVTRRRGKQSRDTLLNTIVLRLFKLQLSVLEKHVKHKIYYFCGMKW